MKAKGKSFLIILAVLVIGFILGLLTGGAFRNQRTEHFRRMSPQEKFTKVMEKIINPDEKQRKAIEEILEIQSRKIGDLHEKQSAEFFTIFDSTRQKINSILTDDQRKRLQEHMESTRGRFRHMEMDRMVKFLDLSGGQEIQLKQIFDRFKNQIESDRKKGDIDQHNDTIGKFKEMEEEIKKILTPQQKEKFDSFKDRRWMPFGKPMKPHSKRRRRPSDK